MLDENGIYYGPKTVAISDTAATPFSRQVQSCFPSIIKSDSEVEPTPRWSYSTQNPLRLENRQKCCHLHHSRSEEVPSVKLKEFSIVWEMLQEPRWLVVWMCLRWSTASVVSQRDRWIRDGLGRQIFGVPLMSTCWPEVAWLLLRFQNKLLTTVVRLYWVPLVQESVHTCGCSVSSSQMAKVSMFLTVPQTRIVLSTPGICVTSVHGCTKMLQNRFHWCPNPSLGEPPGAPHPSHTQTHIQDHTSHESDSESSQEISNWNISCTEPLNVLLLFCYLPWPQVSFQQKFTKGLLQSHCQIVQIDFIMICCPHPAYSTMFVSSLPKAWFVSICRAAVLENKNGASSCNVCATLFAVFVVDFGCRRKSYYCCPSCLVFCCVLLALWIHRV